MEGGASGLELSAPYQLQHHHTKKTDGEDAVSSPHRQQQRYANERNRLGVIPSPSSNNTAVEGFCIRRDERAVHPDYQHLPDWHTNNNNHDPTIMTRRKPEMLSALDDIVWNEFCDALTQAIHNERRDEILIAIGFIASFLVLFWPAKNHFELCKEIDPNCINVDYCRNCQISWWEAKPPMDQFLTAKNTRTFIHIFTVIFFGGVWLVLWLVASERVKRTIQQFNVYFLEKNVKVKLERYYRGTLSEKKPYESKYILFIKQQQHPSDDRMATFGVSREPSDIDRIRWDSSYIFV